MPQRECSRFDREWSRGAMIAALVATLALVHPALAGAAADAQLARVPALGFAPDRVCTDPGLAAGWRFRLPAMDTALYGLAVLLIMAGLVGALVPALPGIPLIFAGIWLIAGVDGYRHIGLWWLLGIAVVGTVGLTLDLLAGALGATRVGASRQALWGSLLGTVIGLFFGLPGLLLGPFIGALAGELAAGKGVVRSTQVGVSTWIGLIFGTILKLVSSVTMVALGGAAWWWNRAA